MSFRMIQSVFTFDKLLQRLQLGKEETPFVIWHEKDLFGTHDNPVKIDIPCLFLCLDGRKGGIIMNQNRKKKNRKKETGAVAPSSLTIFPI